jgi:hypothetical protein
VAQDLGAIISELDAAYNPSKQAINDRINGLGAAEQADISELQGQQKNAFDDITAGSIARGVFYGGAPIAEQQKYTSRNFLPAVAKVKQQYVANRGSLTDALNSLNMDQQKTAMSLRETQVDRDWRAAEAEKERAAARAASAAANTNWSSFLGGGNTQQTQKPAANQAPKTDPVQQRAFDFAKSMGDKGPAAVLSDFRAARAYYEKTGNQNDLYKLEAYKKLYPEILGTASWKQSSGKAMYF